MDFLTARRERWAFGLDRNASCIRVALCSEYCSPQNRDVTVSGCDSRSDSGAGGSTPGVLVPRWSLCADASHAIWHREAQDQVGVPSGQPVDVTSRTERYKWEMHKNWTVLLHKTLDLFLFCCKNLLFTHLVISQYFNFSLRLITIKR